MHHSIRGRRQVARWRVAAERFAVVKNILSLLAVGFLLVTGQRAVAAGASVPELWFAPNDDLPRGPNRDRIPGPDFQHLFDPTPVWSMRTDVFQLSPMMTSNVGPEDELRRIGAFLTQHHIALAVGVGAATTDNANPVPGECGFGVEGMGRPGRNAISFKRLKQLGLDIQYVAMDEPLDFCALLFEQERLPLFD
jgi:hypothetical protein